MMPIHFATVLARSPARLLAEVSRLSTVYQGHTLLFALSPNAASSDLAQLVQKLTAFSPQTIGCLSAPLPGHYEGLISCSFALFKPDSCILFRSQIPGRGRAMALISETGNAQLQFEGRTEKLVS
jgi:hypothetical protein